MQPPAEGDQEEEEEGGGRPFPERLTSPPICLFSLQPTRVSEQEDDEKGEGAQLVLNVVDGESEHAARLRRVLFPGSSLPSSFPFFLSSSLELASKGLLDPPGAVVTFVRDGRPSSAAAASSHALPASPSPFLVPPLLPPPPSQLRSVSTLYTQQFLDLPSRSSTPSPAAGPSQQQQSASPSPCALRLAILSLPPSPSSSSTSGQGTQGEWAVVPSVVLKGGRHGEMARRFVQAVERRLRARPLASSPSP